MSRQTYTATSPDDFFSHHALELTFRLLRNNNPGLANAIKKTLDQMSCVPYENLHTSHTGEMHFNAQIVELLNVHIIGRIVSTLTEIGKNALEKQDLPPEHLNMLRSLLDDWVQLTDWILRHNTADKISMH
ncbi:MAG: hypothetical protein EOP48_08030 [Sphingobacteriales bacterium]|nr:MAG: hypothetical protein EOP48_08030 [Sphingobacteriales bacterium]